MEQESGAHSDQGNETSKILQQYLKQLEQQIRKSSKQNSDLEYLEKKYSSTASDLKETQNELKETQQNLTKIDKINLEREIENQTLNKQFANLSEKHGEIQLENKRLMLKNQQLEVEYKCYQEKSINQEIIIDQKNMEIQLLKQELENRNKKLIQKKEKKLLLKQQIESLSEEKAIFKNEQQKQKEENQKLSSELQNLLNKNNELLKTQETLAEKLKESQQTLISNNKAFDQLKQSLADAQKTSFRNMVQTNFKQATLIYEAINENEPDQQFIQKQSPIIDFNTRTIINESQNKVVIEQEDTMAKQGLSLSLTEFYHQKMNKNEDRFDSKDIANDNPLMLKAKQNMMLYKMRTQHDRSLLKVNHF